MTLPIIPLFLFQIQNMKFFQLLIVAAIFVSGCEPKPTVVIPEKKTPHRTQEYLLASTLFVQHSAEYKALCYQAFQTAQMRLEQIVANGPEKPAVVLDIDETVLDNSAYSAWQIERNQPYSPETWEKWTNLAVAREVPGAGEFLRYADSLGVTIFYISNRDSAALKPTIKNMAELNLPQLNEEQFLLKTTTSGKGERRAKVAEMGYEIVMLIGDNLGDFDERWDKQDNGKRGGIKFADRTRFGVEYIVLPNPIYGTWEGEIYHFKRDWTDEERDSLRHSALLPAPIGSGN